MNKNFKFIKDDGSKIIIIREPLREIDKNLNSMRVSIGGNKKDGYYLVFRADSIYKVIPMIKELMEYFNLSITVLKNENE